MARPRTIYVRDQDVATWQEAINAAVEAGISISEYVATAIRERLATGTISVEVLDALGRHEERFEGRWIVRDMRSSAPGASQHNAWSIAVTRFGRFVWYVRRADGVASIGAKDSLAEFKDDLVPGDVVEEAVRVLQRDGYVAWRNV